jgi:hypothetical protein
LFLLWATSLIQVFLLPEIRGLTVCPEALTSPSRGLVGTKWIAPHRVTGKREGSRPAAAANRSEFTGAAFSLYLREVTNPHKDR